MDPSEMQPNDEPLVGRVGPVEIDWPLALGYYGGIGLGLALEIIEPPLALFIAAVPFFKMLNRPNSTLPSRALAQLLAGASKPVGGDGEAAIRLNPQTASSPMSWGLRSLAVRAREGTGSIWTEAQSLRRGA